MFIEERNAFDWNLMKNKSCCILSFVIVVIFKFYMISVLALPRSCFASLASSFPLGAAYCCTLFDFSIIRPQWLHLYDIDMTHPLFLSLSLQSHFSTWKNTLQWHLWQNDRLFMTDTSRLTLWIYIRVGWQGCLWVKTSATFYSLVFLAERNVLQFLFFPWWLHKTTCTMWMFLQGHIGSQGTAMRHP
jgi:hypothetical protein